MARIGIEWVNKYHGRAANLSNNDNNARGFANHLDGTVAFEWGNDLAWDEDFEQKGTTTNSAGTDQRYADNVDIVFFSGHGSASGAFFGVDAHDSGQAEPKQMVLGDRQCEWAIFDACEVLSHSATNSVFTRWKGSFKGLHYLLGFHTTSTDSGSRAGSATP